MLTSLSSTDRTTLLRFAASFLWADLEVADEERRFLDDLARELDLDDAEGAVAHLLARPPEPEEIDPAKVPRAMADIVRHTALRAIAADGRVAKEEMRMFDLLDALLPRGEDDDEPRRRSEIDIDADDDESPDMDDLVY